MDLILWRHAQAQDISSVPAAELGPATAADMARPLTALGLQQANRMAHWLKRRLNSKVRVMTSPALRCEQTVLALGRPYSLHGELAPDRGPGELLSLAEWPLSEQAVLVVGHQPTLSLVVTQVLGLGQAEFVFRKGSIWWLRCRQRNNQLQTVVVTVQSPDAL